jgi:hypothetical protein
MVGIFVHGDNHSQNSNCLENGVTGKFIRQPGQLAKNRHITHRQMISRQVAG